MTKGFKSECSKHHTLLKSVSEILFIYCPMWAKFGIRKLPPNRGDKPSYAVQQARGEILPTRRREPGICQLLVGCALSKYEDSSVSGTWVKSCRLPSESDESKEFIIFVEARNSATLLL